MQQKITPFFWFGENLKETLAYYNGIFNREGAEHFKEIKYKMLSDTPGQSIEMATVELFGNTYHFMGAKQYVEFTDAISLMISTEDQAETDYYWDAFTKEGKESACGWCKDKYGVSWQITPKRLMELNSSSDKEVAQYSMQQMMQMMQMKKIIIKDLER
jgi:predicted 3-demethylubiquinone-9 3-methyltransferase (glyoxalase superfamily)